MANVYVNGCTETDDAPLFDPAILSRLEPSKFKATYKNGVSPQTPGENLHIRPLSSGDYERGYLELLKQLTTVGDLSKEKFLERFNKMKGCDDTYYVTVIEDLSTGQRGRVEDVIVSDLYRGKQLGKILVDILAALSQELGCYKLSLECKDENVQFYLPFGFEKTPAQNFMQIRFFD